MTAVTCLMESVCPPVGPFTGPNSAAGGADERGYDVLNESS